MEAMKAEEEDLQVADEADEAVEVREKTTKKRKIVIIGANLCKCPRSHFGEAGCRDEPEEKVTAMLPNRPRSVTTEPEQAGISEDDTQALR